MTHIQMCCDRPFHADLYLGETPQYIPYMTTSTAPRSTSKFDLSFLFLSVSGKIS